MMLQIIKSPKANTILAALLVLLFTAPLFAQHLDSFDSIEPTWELRESNCGVNASSLIQERVRTEQASGRFEQFQYRAGAGSRVLVSHEIPKCYIIPELNPSVRVKARRNGVQLMVRVVLPETPSEPNSTKPMTTLLKGPSYTGANTWQRLSFGGDDFDLKKLLNRHIWVLRSKYGSHVTARNAYIDLVVLNIYTGRGNQTVGVDELHIGGIVSAENTKSLTLVDDSKVQPVGFQQEVQFKSNVIRRGTVIEVNQAPFFARVIQHNGEAFDFLKSLGFNTIELQATATSEQLDQAEKLDLWLVCPPPPSVGLQRITAEYDRVLAWSLGQQLETRDVNSIRTTVQEIRESDIRKGRPTVANMISGWSRAADFVDILNTGFEPLGSSFPLSQYGDWITQKSSLTRKTHPLWGDIQTEIGRQCREQVSGFVGVVPPTPIEPQQMKFMAYEIIASGGRGIRFRSRSRLDSADPSTALRSKTIQWLNRHLNQISPWVAGGAIFPSRNRSSDQLVVTPIRTARSQLLLLQRQTGMEQHYAGDPPPRSIQLDDEGAAQTDRAYAILDQGLIPLSDQRDHIGSRISLDDFSYTGAVVLTQDPHVVSRLNQDYRAAGQTPMQAKLELVQQWLTITQLIQNQVEREGVTTPGVQASIQESLNAMRKAESLLNGASPESAAKFLNLAEQRLAVARRELMLPILNQFKSKTSSPFMMHPSLVPLHYRIAQGLAGSEWEPNSLPGGDFESLQHMTNNGWENKRIKVTGIETQVELAKTSKVAGRYGMKLSVTGQPTGSLEHPPLSITTAPVVVKPGNLVRIHGWIRIESPITHSSNGLMIVDSLGGDELAERIPATEGWQEFALYRTVPTQSNLTVKFELAGVGVVELDEVTIRSIALPSSSRQARLDQ